MYRVKKHKRSWVQGSSFRVAFLSLALLVGQQVFDETTNGTAGTSSMINVMTLSLIQRQESSLQTSVQNHSKLTKQLLRFSVNPEP